MKIVFFLCCVVVLQGFCGTKTGLDRFFQEGYDVQLAGKKIGIFTNHTGINSNIQGTISLFDEKAKAFQVKAIFIPEHGLTGSALAGEKVNSLVGKRPVYSLYGKVRRPTEEMLKGLDVIVCDIQDVGVRTYTYISTLFYIMEECAKYGVKVIVLDRPNPIGEIVDGPMMEEKNRSFIGYINIPICHGMTIGELAQYFNEEYGIKCNLSVVPMAGYQRVMSFGDTSLPWMPTSPNIPEADTPFFYATTNLLGELSLVNIGVGCPLSFKVVGAPWIDADKLAKALNEQKLPGAYFAPMHFKPFYGKYKDEECHGVLIFIRDKKIYQPVMSQFMIIGILKSLYPDMVDKALKALPADRRQFFAKATGSDAIFQILLSEKYPAKKLIDFHKKERESFLAKRKKALIKEYD